VGKTACVVIVLLGLLAGTHVFQRAWRHRSASIRVPLKAAPGAAKDLNAFCALRSLGPLGIAPLKRPRALHKRSQRSLNDVQRALRDAGWMPSLWRASTSCPRMLAGATEPGGLGHRFTALVHLVLFANASESTMVLPKLFFSEQVGHESSADAYGWAADLVLGALAGKVLREPPPGMPTASTFMRGEDFLAEMRKGRACNRSSIGYVGGRNFCANTYCVMTQPDSFRRARSFFLLVVDAAPPRNSHPVAAWHVRVGDQLLGSSAAFVSLACQLPPDTVHVVYSSRPLCSNGQNMLFCDFVRLLPKATFVSNLPTCDVVRAMMSAEFLINTGSSFAAVAAEVSHDQQVVLAFGAKDGPTATQSYDRGDTVFVAADGIIENRTAFLEKLKGLAG
jgi:hypothetical protein